MKKTILSIVLMLAMLMSIAVLPAFASETVLITVSEQTALPGEEVAVTVSIANNTGLASLKLDVEYDDVLTLTNVSFNGEFGETVTAPEPYRNPEPLTMISPLADVTANGVFATLTFVVDSNAEAGYKAKISISYEADDFFDSDFETIPVNVINGSVTIGEIKDYLLGDITGDGVVDINDPLQLFRHCMLPDVYLITYPGNPDFTKDSILDISDAILLFRYSLLPDMYPIG